MKILYNKLEWQFLFSIGFFKFRKPFKRIATLTSRKTIEKFSHNKKLLNQQNINQEESSETKFNQILFSSTPGEVEETSKIEEKTI